MRVECDRTILADQGRLRQLPENLLRNRMEHGPTSPQSNAPGSVTERSSGAVTIEVGDVDDGRTQGFYVADDGIGIPADERDDVFGPGYSTATDGPGFGLHIVGRIAEEHGRDVRVSESAAGGVRSEITGVEVVTADD